MEIARLNRRQFLQGGFALAGLSLTSACGFVLPSSKPVSKTRRLGLFHVGLDHVPASLDPLREELARLGYQEGQNIELDWRNLANEAAAQTVAREFVRNRVEIIVAFENQTMRAVKDATSEIPVVFLHVDDPVANGWVESLSHPGGNLTGFVGQPDLPDKRIEYFKQVLPSLRRLLILLDPSDAITPRVMPAARKAAAALAIELVERDVVSQESLEQVFAELRPSDVDGVFLASRNIQTNFTLPIIRLGLERRLPVASHRKEFVEQGALFSYGPDQATTGRLGARLIGKILDGARPRDLPVEQMDVLEFVINMQVARSLGFSVPPEVLAQATEIIQ